MRKISLLAAIVIACMATQAQAACQIADIMFGDIELSIVPNEDYETAIVRSATFKDPKKNFGALLGEVTVDRGGFAVRDPNQVVVGTISPKLELEGWDDACDKRQRVMIRRVQSGAYVIMNGNTPVGTIKGRFPKNGFGVR